MSINKELIEEINEVFETFVKLQWNWNNRNSTAADLTKIYYSRLPKKEIVPPKKPKVT